ncbi:hypothetical protein QE152_g37208 [Popillia japonica]|uniref:Uncharacterized protein n=1 Tax=Popillia japonica TaxID=7064 RepID=A0AAW1IBA1_POPJA
MKQDSANYIKYFLFIVLGLPSEYEYLSRNLRVENDANYIKYFLFIVLGLPSEYEYLSRNLRVENDDLTLSKLKSKLLEEERRIRDSNEEKIQVETKAYAAKTSKFFKRKPQRGSDEKKPNLESKSHENLRRRLSYETARRRTAKLETQNIVRDETKELSIPIPTEEGLDFLGNKNHKKDDLNITQQIENED